MDFARALRSEVFLTEGSVYERLRRHPDLPFDAHVAHASLIYHRSARDVLEAVHREYLDVGLRHGVPMLILSDTWRASAERIARSPYRDRRVNEDHGRFLCVLRDEYRRSGMTVFAGGLLGCRGDAYRPEEALSADDAEGFHAPQIRALAATGLDFLLASTLPAFSEALGIARAMAATGKPYVLSFVVRPDGRLLDGVPLSRVVTDIDSDVARRPAGYWVNCVHPSIFTRAMSVEAPGGTWRSRILGLQANTSARSPEELDGLAELETEEPSLFADEMRVARERFELCVVGGCCGTDARHIEALALDR